MNHKSTDTVQGHPSNDFESNPYKRAYEREKKARQLAERILDDKSRELYITNKSLSASMEEIKLTHKKLAHSEKMASIGLLSAGMSHEINNPIGFILSNMSTLHEYVEILTELFISFNNLDKYINTGNKILAKDELKKIKLLKREEDISFIMEDLAILVETSVDGLNRVSDIVSKLKKLSDQSTDEDNIRHKTDINRLIHEVTTEMKETYNYNNEIFFHLSTCSEIAINAPQIKQALKHLIINAQQSYDEDFEGTIDIYTDCSDSQLKIIIQDYGCGMDEKVQSSIFDPFFTTREVGSGAGLGLTITFDIIEKHQGSISVESECGKGSTFKISLPILKED